MATHRKPGFWRLHGISAASIATVVIAHAALLAVLFWAPDRSVKRIELPAITGMLIPAPPAEQVQAPAAAASSMQETQETESTKVEPEPVAKPEPKLKPKVEPRISKEPRPAPKPEPVPEPTATEKPQTVPSKETLGEMEPNQTLTTESTVESQATPNEELGAPITPPNADAAHLNNPAPAYPRLSRRLREEGVVLLEVLIMPDGSVGDIKIQQSSGYSRLDETALEAVQQWRYEPARRGSEAIAYWYLQPVDFSLD